MSEIFIDVILANLPQIVSIIIALLGAIVTRKIVPLITTTKNAKRLSEVIAFAQVLVDSAYRLDKSGKLLEATKKEYVMEQLDAYIVEKGYKFTPEQLDNIRRAAVVALEQTEQIVSDVIEKVEETATENK